MKPLFYTALICILSFSTNAQHIVEKTLPVNKNQRIELDFQFADVINISVWDKNEIYVKATVDINYGSDNDKFKFDVFEGSTFIKIEAEIEDLKKISRKGHRIIIDGNDTIYSDGCHTNIELDFEVFMPAECELELETISGNIEIGGINEEMDIKTISGDIDFNLNEKAKVDVSMKTISGSLYTNLDIELKDKHHNMHHIGGDVEARLNGGGNFIDLETISGDIYLRKAE